MDTNNFSNNIFFCHIIFFKKFKILNDDINSSNHKKLVTSFQSPVLIGGFF